MRKILALIGVLLVSGPALADWTGKNAAGSTVTFKNPLDCTSVVCVPLAQLYDGTNVVTLTTAGADAVSNTLTGLPTYARLLRYNGTSWDRWTGAVTIASGGVVAGAFATGSIVDGAYLTDGAIADAAVTAGATGSNSAKLRAISRDIGTIATNSGLPLPTQSSTVPIGGTSLCDGANGTTNPCTTAQTVLAASTASAAANKAAVVALSPNQGTPATINQYPFGATPITASATGTTGATTATLAGTSGKTTYICGYSIRANATAATTVTNTITGVITATLSSIMWIAPLASGIGVDEQIFTPCIPASGTNQAIAVVSGAPGSGGTVSSKGWGYQL